MTDVIERNATIQKTIDELGITISQVLSPSVNHARPNRIPNCMIYRSIWRVTLLRNGREILQTDYTAGCAHCPAYTATTFGRATVDQLRAIELECEEGRRVTPSMFQGKPILPNTLDVLHSIVQDSEALEYGEFEDWCRNSGYDPDSRKAESSYRDCLGLGLKLRAGLGDNGIARLREAFQDY